MFIQAIFCCSSPSTTVVESSAFDFAFYIRSSAELFVHIGVSPDGFASVVTFQEFCFV